MPYEPLTRFPTPPDETVVWRYMDFPKFTLLLAHSALWFARCDHLEDRFEGSLTAPMVRRYEGLAFAPQVADAIQLFREHRKRMRERVAVNCWHMGACESAALWQAYGREGQGIVVRTRLGGLKEAVARVSYPVHIAPVTYLNYKEDDMEPPGSDINRLRPLLCKQASYQHEQEVRMLLWMQPSLEHDNPPLHGPGLAIPVLLDKLVESVRVHPLMPPWQLDLVRLLATQASVDPSCIGRSELTDDPLF